MMKPLLPALFLSLALGASPVLAGPHADVALQFLGITTNIDGDSSNNFVTFPATVGQIGQTFSGSAQSAVGIPAFAIGLGSYQSNSDAVSVEWDARFKVVQPDTTIFVEFALYDYASAATSFYAYASGHSSVDLMVNGVSQLSDSRRTSCNTTVRSCESNSPNAGNWTILLTHLYVGQMIDIAGSLSADVSATAGPVCGTLTSSVVCYGVGIGFSSATFSITSIPEPPVVALLILGLAGFAFSRRRD